MKLLILFCISITAVFTKERCTDLEEVLICRNLELRAGEHLNINTTSTKLAVAGATGTIGIHTFSLMTQLTELNIRDSRISNIENGVLCSLPNLEKLQLVSNDEFPILNEDLLSNCDKIKYLVVRKTHFDLTAFRNMPNLEELVLAELKINHFTQDYLHPLKQLKFIDLWGSEIEELDAGALCSSPQLEKLHLNDNRLPVLEDSSFSNCENVKSLIIKGSGIGPTAFKNIPNLENLELRDLNIDNFSQSYLQPLKQLKYLMIFRCHIEQIDAGAICSSGNLKELKLVRSRYLPNLTRSVFEDCYSVEEFKYGFQSRRYEIEEDTFAGLVNVKEFSVTTLNVNTLSKGYLRGLSNIEDLVIEQSNIETINEDAFEGLVKLRNLSLSRNKINQIHPNNAFTLLLSLCRLSLSSNEINQIDSVALEPLTSLVALDLSYNKLTTIDNIKHATLEELKVASNSITAIDAELVKSNLPNLKSLSVANNNMSSEYEESLRVQFGEIKFTGTSDT